MCGCLVNQQARQKFNNPGRNSAQDLNPIQMGPFFGLLGLEGGEGGADSAPPPNSENIKAITRKLGGQIVLPKRFL